MPFLFNFCKEIQGVPQKIITYLTYIGYISTSEPRILTILVSNANNIPLIMGGHKNFEDLMLRSRDLAYVKTVCDNLFLGHPVQRIKKIYIKETLFPEEYQVFSI